MITPELLETLAQVDAAREEVQLPGVFIGALPVLAFGRPRATTDIDLLLFCDVAGLSRFDDALRRRGLARGADVGPAEPEDPLPDIAVYWTATRPTVRVDVFVAKMDFETAVHQRAREVSVLGRRLRLAPPEASIIYKLIASRAKDLADVESIFETRAAAGEAMDWGFLDEWAAAWGIEEKLAIHAERFR
jgi:hypothetical protein